MSQRIRGSLSFSNVIAVAALFFALGGTVYAAAGKISGAQIKPNSIPGNRIKPKSLTATQIKAAAVSGAQIKAGSISAGKIQSGTLTATQIKAGSLTGTQIKSGSLTGAQVNGGTLTGVSAAAIGTVQYVTVAAAINPESPSGTSATANCPTGMKVIGGGATVSNPAAALVNESGPATSRTGWVADGFGETGTSLTVTAVCTPVTTSTG
jgi:hypothetical protein